MADSNKESNITGLEPIVQQVEEVAGIMKDNRDKVLEREGKLSDLDSRANNLREAATKFNTNATAVKKKMWWENMKAKLCFGASTFFIVILIIIIILHQLGLLTSSSEGSQSAPPSPQLKIIPSNSSSTNPDLQPSSIE